MAKQYRTKCNVCHETITPDQPCPHLWVNELGQVYKVSDGHQYEPEPGVKARLTEVPDLKDGGYKRPDVTLTPPDPKDGKDEKKS